MLWIDLMRINFPEPPKPAVQDSEKLARLVEAAEKANANLASLPKYLAKQYEAHRLILLSLIEEETKKPVVK
jgi:hypothetical protein